MARSGRSAGLWAVPSAIAACAGALVTGAVEGLSISAEGVATIGYASMLVVPLLLISGMVVRGVVAAWRPRRVLDGLIEEGGAAPRLVGWIATIGLVCAVVAAAVYRGTWAIAARTDFQPLVVGFVLPVIAICAAAAGFAASRPAVDLFASLARRLDARWRRSGRATLLAPRLIVLGCAALAVAGGALVWFVLIKPEIGPLDTSVLYAPVLGLLATWLAHLGYRRLSRRRLAGAILSIAVAATIGFAVFTRFDHPSLAIEIWGDRPVAGLAVDLVYNIDDIRGDISLAEFRPVDRPGAAHPDIVLVTIDTVRADHTPPYGGSAQMAALRELGQRGAVFEHAFAPSNVTRRSIPSMVIGYAPHRIRGRVIGWALRVDPRFVLLAERLRAGGYETAGFMCCPGFWAPESRTGLSRGLEHLEVDREKDGKQFITGARDWLAAREAAGRTAPLFVWVHILEPHNWTKGGNAPTAADARQQLYDRALVQADDMLATVLAPFAGRSPDRAPIVIVTADHGEALGDHGTPFHSTDLYNSQLHVPFVIAGPGIPAARLAETVSLTDLVPTIVDLAGFQPPTELDGHSLADAITGKRPSVEDTGSAFAVMVKDRSNPGGLSAFVRGRFKLIVGDAGNVELYDVIADPKERDNLASRRPELVRELQPLLDAKLGLSKVSPF